MRRTVPSGSLLNSLTVIRHDGIRKEATSNLKKWAGKDQASFAEMEVALRRDSKAQLRSEHLSTRDVPPGDQESINPLEYLIALVA